MKVSSIKKGLAAAAEAVESLTTYPFCPTAVEVPCFYAGETEISYHETYGGDAEVVVMGYVLVASGEDEDGQALLDDYLSVGNPDSVVDALEGTPGNPQTLGGACDDVVIMQATGYRMYEVGGKNFFGAKLPIRVLGVRSQE